MILGRVRDHLPRVTLSLPGPTGAISVEFVVDTGFDGEMAQPSSLVRQTTAYPQFLSLRAMADGSVRE